MDDPKSKIQVLPSVPIFTEIEPVETVLDLWFNSINDITQLPGAAEPQNPVKWAVMQALYNAKGRPVQLLVRFCNPPPSPPKPDDATQTLVYRLPYVLPVSDSPELDYDVVRQQREAEQAAEDQLLEHSLHPDKGWPPAWMQEQPKPWGQQVWVVKDEQVVGTDTTKVSMSAKIVSGGKPSANGDIFPNDVYTTVAYEDLFASKDPWKWPTPPAYQRHLQHMLLLGPFHVDVQPEYGWRTRGMKIDEWVFGVNDVRRATGTACGAPVYTPGPEPVPTRRIWFGETPLGLAYSDVPITELCLTNQLIVRPEYGWSWSKAICHYSILQLPRTLGKSYLLASEIGKPITCHYRFHDYGNQVVPPPGTYGESLATRWVRAHYRLRDHKIGEPVIACAQPPDSKSTFGN
jgi:hypothetical protein